MIEINTEPDAEHFFAELFRDHPASVTKAATKSFDGRPDEIAILVSLSAAIVPLVSKIITELIRARKSCIVKHKGIEVRGFSESSTKEILDSLLDREQTRKPPHDDR